MSIFKIIGIVLIIISGAFIGNYFASKITNNKLALKDIILLFTELENNITFKKDNILLAIKKANKSCCFDVISIQSNKLDYKEYIDDILDNKLQDFFTKKQFTMLQESLHQMGDSIIKVEKSKFSYYISYFEQELKAAKETEEKNAKLYRSLGFCGAIAVAIFLI